MKKPIEVFVRHCFHSPNTLLPNRSRPNWFGKRDCWENLWATTNHELANVSVVYDSHFGPMPEYLSHATFPVYEIKEGTEAESFLRMLDIIMEKNLDDDTVVYMVEDDYLHRRRWSEVLLEAFTTGTDYATLYDHADKYMHYPHLKSSLFVTESSHWRTTPSTCNTYACKMKQLREDIEIHRHYSQITDNKITHDHAKFVALGERGKTLISPIPGWSTHCDGYPSPVINWENVNRLYL